MHDLVSDLAKFISKQFTLSHEDDYSSEILSKTRHFSHSCKNIDIKKFAATFHESKRLCTVLKFNFDSSLYRFGIEELGKLTNLRERSLSILDLQNIGSPMDGKDVKYLRDRKYLKELVLEWKVGNNTLESHLIVLESLQPLSNLKSLVINGYGGKSFPNWVGHPSFSNIASLHLEDCKFCCSLPPLGQLPSLQDLSIAGLDRVVRLGCEFYGSESSSIKPFQSLKVISFKNMLNWEKWFSFDVGKEDGAFPNLRNLEIHECPKLTCFLKGGLRAPSLEVFRITKCKSLSSLPDKMHIFFSSLEELYIEYCPEVESFPEGRLPSNLNIIYISNCEKLFARRMRWDLRNLPSVKIFEVIGKSEDVESFPDEGLLPTTLTRLHIEGFENLKYLDKKGLQHLTTLEELKMWNCPKLECMPKDGLPASLTTLNISNYTVDGLEQLQQEPDGCANPAADDGVQYTLIVGDYNDVYKMADAYGASYLKDSH
ncbi:putative disease resistance protein At3g14460 [Corylus avellana]|uniref:putative disease resistance protein At3g14460 n=1 Tax=Corylus avellana TaxID=13451 RepID=UPI00286B4925|nr:putative disease resistance protein At3g14460 [Corylus avellana]